MSDGGQLERDKKDVFHTPAPQPADHSHTRKKSLERTSLSEYQIEALQVIPIGTVKQAWFTMSHLLLEPGATIAVMGCEDGSFPYALAILNPEFHIIGVDSNRKVITEAKQKWQLPNLEFVVSRITRPSFPDGVLDAVVDSFTLHEVYSGLGFSETRVREMLDSHFQMLKSGGLLFLRDYAHPPPGEYVRMEFPDVESRGHDPEDLSEVDLLINFSDQARANNSEEGRGFFLEEMDPINPKTRLFRLNFKWAYEFILRKDNRLYWDKELKKEYTFMTSREMRKTLRNLGARVLYDAPLWDQEIIRNNYDRHFKLYDDDGRPLGYPPTSHVFVARKIDEGQSQILSERRPSREPVKRLKIEAMRNSRSGQVYELVSRETEIVEFVPYRISETGRLHVYLHDGLPRAIINAVPRSGKNLDGKRWSGHMVEALPIDRIVMSEYSEPMNEEESIQLARNHLGMKPESGRTVIKGPEFYPNPKMIDERIETRFLEVQKPEKSLSPSWGNKIAGAFSDQGKIKEFDAQHVLDAISVGYIPNARLEMQLMALFQILGIQSHSWAESPLHLEEQDVKSVSLADLLKIMTDKRNPFERVEGGYNQIRSIHSYFVDEGYENGAMKGLSARDIEFVVNERQTLNTALALPLVRNLSGEIMAGFVSEYLPAPQRHKRQSHSISLPSFNLPPEVKDMEAARAYVAQQFNVPTEKVIRLGESYFMHNSVTPQRIFPFAVAPAANPIKYNLGSNTWIEYAPMRWFWRLYWHMWVDYLPVIYKKAISNMHKDIDFGLETKTSMLSGLTANVWPSHPDYGTPIMNFSGDNPMAALEEMIKSGKIDFALAPSPAPAKTVKTDGKTGGEDTGGSGGGQHVESRETHKNDQPLKDQKIRAMLRALRGDDADSAYDYDMADEDPDGMPDMDAPMSQKSQDPAGANHTLSAKPRPPSSAISTNIIKPSVSEIAEDTGDTSSQSSSSGGGAHMDVRSNDQEQPNKPKAALKKPSLVKTFGNFEFVGDAKEDSPEKAAADHLKEEADRPKRVAPLKPVSSAPAKSATVTPIHNVNDIRLFDDDYDDMAAGEEDSKPDLPQFDNS